MKYLLLISCLLLVSFCGQICFAQTAGYLGSDVKYVAPYNPNHPNQLPSRKPLPIRQPSIQNIPNNFYSPQIFRVYPSAPIITSPNGVIYYNNPIYYGY